MAKKIPIEAGDVLLIPLSDVAAVLGKVLYLYRKQFKGVLMVGVATDRLVDPRKPPEPRVSTWQLVKFTMRSAVDAGHWKILGHDPSAIPAQATMYRMAGGVFQEEELLRHETAADVERIPQQAVGGYFATVHHVCSMLRLEPPRPVAQPKSAPAKKRASTRARAGGLDEDRFWAMIEDAWTSAAPSLAKKRPGITAKVSPKNAKALSAALDSDVVPALKTALGSLSRDELIQFDRILERKLYDIDRADVQRHTDGSDDGFLYARGFVVGMGRRHYEAVRADPSKAITDMEEEGITYLPHRIFEERFDEDLPRSDISRETGSNKAGWR
jgi:hypothetical protein